MQSVQYTGGSALDAIGYNHLHVLTGRLQAHHISYRLRYLVTRLTRSYLVSSENVY